MEVTINGVSHSVPGIFFERCDVVERLKEMANIDGACSIQFRNDSGELWKTLPEMMQPRIRNGMIFKIEKKHEV